MTQSIFIKRVSIYCNRTIERTSHGIWNEWCKQLLRIFFTDNEVVKEYKLTKWRSSFRLPDRILSFCFSCFPLNAAVWQPKLDLIINYLARERLYSFIMYNPGRSQFFNFFSQVMRYRLYFLKLFSEQFTLEWL